MMRFHWIPRDAVHLAASLDLPDDPPGDGGRAERYPVVIVTHGLTGQRLGKSYHLVAFARRLASMGIACLRFDQAGCGESTGDFTDLTIPTMCDDLRAVVQWVGEQPELDAQRLGFVGLSLGALPTVQVESEHGGVGVALWAPVYDMPRTFGNTAASGLRGILEQQGWVPYRCLPIGKGFVDHLDAVDVPARLADSDSPMLICHAADDAIVDYSESRCYVDRCGALGRPCEHLHFEEANHDFFTWPARQRLLAGTTTFFDNALKPT